MNTELIQQQIELGGQTMPFGPLPPEGPGIEVTEDFGHYEAEYAALRRSVGIFHAPQRGLIELTGDERQDFLHRMLTQDINRLQGGHGTRGFLLTVKGRIIADIIVHHGDVSTWIETDLFDTPAVIEHLDGRLFGEDVKLTNLTPWATTTTVAATSTSPPDIATPEVENHDEAHLRTCLQVIGPAALALLQQACDQVPKHFQDPGIVANHTHHVLPVKGHLVSACRVDLGEVLAFHVWVRQQDAPSVYQKLLQTAGYQTSSQTDAIDPADWADQRRSGLRGRPVGWAALNTLRIEEKQPLFHIDFGPDSIPNETSLMDHTVSFTAGCYPGQEVVCRIKDLGHPKRVVAHLAFETDQLDQLPVAGAPIMCDGKAIGGVTSSCLSPIQGQKPIGIGTLKWGFHLPSEKSGKSLQVGIGQQWINVSVLG